MSARKKSRRTSGKPSSSAKAKHNLAVAQQSSSDRACGSPETGATRKSAHDALTLDRELSDRLIETVRTIILVLDLKGRIVWFNGHFEDLTGYRLDEVHGKDWFESFLPQRDRQRTREVFNRALHGTRTRGNVNPIVTKDGRERIIEWYDAPLADASGELTALLCSGQDITERTQTENALRDQEARLRAILDSAAEGIITIDEDGVIESCNRASEQIFGYSADELAGRNVSILMPASEGKRHSVHIGRYLTTGEAKIIGRGREVVGRRKDGSTFPADLAVSEIFDGRRLFTGIIRDISDRKQLELEVLNAAAHEQRRIGQELHDGLGQELTGLALLARTLSEKLRRDKCDEADVAGEVAEGLQTALTQTRALAKGLIPVEIDADGLMAALEELAENVERRSGVSCRFKCDRPAPIEDNRIANQLYRIAKEAVTNAIRHGQPSEVVVGLHHAHVRQEHIVMGLETDDRHITLYVLDDGVGFDSELQSDEGMGLKIMRYRAQLIGAVLHIGSAKGDGTEVRCTLRLTASDERQKQIDVS